LTGIIAARNIVKTTSRIRKILQFAVQGVRCNAPWSASQHLCGQRDFAALDHEAFQQARLAVRVTLDRANDYRRIVHYRKQMTSCAIGQKIAKRAGSSGTIPPPFAASRKRKLPMHPRYAQVYVVC